VTCGVLLAVPNFSEGRDRGLIERIAAQFASGVELLDTHSDPVHNRTVLTLAGVPRSLGEALVRGAGACQMTIDMRRQRGAHPRIGALDVCPVVWLDGDERAVARVEALTVAKAIGASGVPIFLYGDLATEKARRERSFFREGGLEWLRERMASGELAPDFGPGEPHPSAGATLVTARPPLAAFNVELRGATLEDVRAIAANLREAGGGLHGVRAIAIDLGDGRVQVSTNVHDPAAIPLAAVVGRIRELAPDADLASAEIVGLVPEAALAGWPGEVPLPAFDPATHVIERRIRAG
jgi:glutamate formiminotransferase/glutamate formiminotransferase/formiminotetrahydrofolate cyclodeaminase